MIRVLNSFLFRQNSFKKCPNYYLDKLNFSEKNDIILHNLV